jgi:hypothetical protein
MNICLRTRIKPHPPIIFRLIICQSFAGKTYQTVCEVVINTLKRIYYYYYYLFSPKWQTYSEKELKTRNSLHYRVTGANKFIWRYINVHYHYYYYFVSSYSCCILHRLCRWRRCLKYDYNGAVHIKFENISNPTMPQLRKKYIYPRHLINPVV